MNIFANNEPAIKLINAYVAFLRALYFIHQSHHWQTKGENFYGNHLLFERLYQSAQENSDSAAEKMIGLFGPSSLNISIQAEIVKDITSKFKDLDIIKSSLMAEKEFLEISRMTYDNLKKLDAMTLGLDNLIMQIHDKREEACYLLQQISL